MLNPSLSRRILLLPPRCFSTALSSSSLRWVGRCPMAAATTASTATRYQSSSVTTTEHHDNSFLPPPQQQQPWATFQEQVSANEQVPKQVVDNNNNNNDNNDMPPHHRPPRLVPPPHHTDDWITTTTTTTTTTDAVVVEPPRTSLLMELTDRVGVLHDVLRYFWKYDINVCRIESRPVKSDLRSFDFFVDLEGSTDHPNVALLLTALKPMTSKLLILDEKQVHWFPRHVSELDLIAGRTLDAGTDLESDHPGFQDVVYRARRAALTESAKNHRWDKKIQRIDYTEDEIRVWTTVWDRMEDLWERYACQEYRQSIQLMKDHCGYSRDNIPQQQDISEFLQQRTQFKLRPVAGLLSSRDFLNGLAFRCFFSTQYIRHHSQPLYTPEPDICHELLGHAPMFADRDFADFSQEIGLASLGASDQDVDKLAHCYWHSVEFGLCREGDKNKAYGAGLLSSFGELEYACSDEHPGAAQPPTILPWDPEVASRQEFPITTYQPTYFLADSLSDAKQKMRHYCEDLPRPFFALHNAQTNTVHIDRPVRRTKGCPSPKS